MLNPLKFRAIAHHLRIPADRLETFRPSFTVMSRQQNLEEDDNPRKQLLAYCSENEVTVPFQDLPFEWVDPIQLPPSPPPDLLAALPSHQGIFEEEPHASKMGIEYLAEVLQISNNPDSFPPRTCLIHDLELLLPFQLGEAKFRRYGPINLKKSAMSLPKDTLKGERGMEISNDRSELDHATAKDSLITATQEDVKFLKSMVSEYAQPQQSTIVLPRVLSQSERNTLILAA